jgi:hypothetical protein
MLLSFGLDGDIYHLQAKGWRAGDSQDGVSALYL